MTQTNQTTVDRAVSKSAKRLLPMLTLMLVLAYLDRVNIGFVKIAFQADTGLSEAAYAFGAGIFFLGYALFEVPSNLILKRVGARMWLARIMVTWGIISASMIFARTETLFYALRFLLGVAEAGFYPGVLFFLTRWFPEKQRASAVGLFYLGVPFSLVFGSPLSGWLLQHEGIFGLSGWQFVMVVEGMAAVIVGIIAYFYLCDGPSKARWLSAEESAALTAQIDKEDEAKERQVKHSALSVLKDPRVLAFIAIYFCFQVGNSPFSFFFPAKLASAMNGKVDFTVGLLLALPWLCSAITTRFATTYADRHQNHRSVIIIMVVIGVLASAAVSFLNNPVLLVIAFCIAIPALTASQPVFWNLPTKYLSGVGAASGIAFIVSIGNLGAFFSPQIKVLADRAFESTSLGYLILSLIAGVAAVILLCLRSSNGGESTAAPASSLPQRK